MLFTARNLTKCYAAGTPGCSATARVLCGVHLDLAAGQVAGVVGGRAAGKTTLLRCVAGLARPDAGALRWHDTARRARIVSLAPAAYACDTVRDVVDRACADAAVDPGRLGDALADLALADLLARAHMALTTDQRARLALAIGLAARHPLLLLDATADAIAPAVRPTVRSLLERHAAAGGAVLIAGRDLHAVRGVAPAVHELRDGRLVPLAAGADRQPPARVAERSAAPAASALR